MAAAEKPLTVDDKLSLVKFEHDEEPFITVDTKLCASCRDKPCLYVCPAKVYQLEGDALVYNTEGCIELGACAVVCQKMGRGAIRWNYPRGGYGVEFKFG
jgi:ferredoxin like protein